MSNLYANIPRSMLHEYGLNHSTAAVTVVVVVVAVAVVAATAVAVASAAVNNRQVDQKGDEDITEKFTFSDSRQLRTKPSVTMAYSCIENTQAMKSCLRPTRR